MTIKARLENGIVVEILDADPFPPFNAALVWVDCAPTVAAGYTYDGVNFSAPAGPTAAQLWTAYQQEAQAILDFDDTVAIRCIKASVPYPAAWLARDVAARAIVAAPSGDPTQPLPPQPATYPAGT